MAALRAVVAWCLVWLSLAELCFGQVPPFAPASSAAAPFVSRYYSQATTFYGRTILFGGIDGNGNILNDVWSSRDDGASWSFVPNTGLPARYSGALVTIQTVVNNTQLLLFVGGAGSTGASSNAVYFSVDGATFVPTGNANFSARLSFAYTIALPVQDQSGNPTLNGLPALFILGGSGGSVGLNDVYYSSAAQLTAAADSARLLRSRYCRIALILDTDCPTLTLCCWLCRASVARVVACSASCWLQLKPRGLLARITRR